jgi:hypothetical protein
MYFSTKITNLTVGINSIPMLTGSNYKEWKDTLEIILGYLDLDIALQQAKPHVPACATFFRALRTAARF